MNGRVYFIRMADRLTRIWEPGMLPIPRDSGWAKVSMRRYNAFRKETKAMTKAQLAKWKREQQEQAA